MKYCLQFINKLMQLTKQCDEYEIQIDNQPTKQYNEQPNEQEICLDDQSDDILILKQNTNNQSIICDDIILEQINGLTCLGWYNRNSNFIIERFTDEIWQLIEYYSNGDIKTSISFKNKLLHGDYIINSRCGMFKRTYYDGILLNTVYKK